MPNPIFRIFFFFFFFQLSGKNEKIGWKVAKKKKQKVDQKHYKKEFMHFTLLIFEKKEQTYMYVDKPFI